jgi:hypothetical protein
MEIQQINITEIKEYEKNAKKHDEQQINNVMQSIKEFGMVQPIVIDQNNIIIIGHCRFKALKRLKYKEVPCVKIENLSEKDINKLRLLDNKLNESEWDFDLLSDQIAEIDWSDFDLDWSFLDEEIENEIERTDLSDNYQEKLQIIIECENEEMQEKLYQEFTERGLTCQLSTL